jgi:hypothetical protein
MASSKGAMSTQPPAGAHVKDFNGSWRPGANHTGSWYPQIAEQLRCCALDFNLAVVLTNHVVDYFKQSADAARRKVGSTACVHAHIADEQRRNRTQMLFMHIPSQPATCLCCMAAEVWLVSV